MKLSQLPVRVVILFCNFVVYNIVAMKKQLISEYVVLAVFLIHTSCTYDARKELEGEKLKPTSNTSKHLKLYLQTMIDSIVRDLEYKDYNRVMNNLNSMYINTKYTNIRNKSLKKQLLTKIKEIRNIIEKASYNRVVILKLEQLRQLSNKL